MPKINLDDVFTVSLDFKPITLSATVLQSALAAAPALSAGFCKILCFHPEFISVLGRQRHLPDAADKGGDRA